MIRQLVRNEKRRQRLGEPGHVLGGIDQRNGQVSRRMQDGQAERA